MRSLDSFLDASYSSGNDVDFEGRGIPTPSAVAYVRRAIAAALRKPEVVDGILAAVRIPGILRLVARPFVVRALGYAADWISPGSPDPA